MALDKNVLDRLNANAQLVHDETKASANTHTRVGQAFLDTHELFTEVENDESDIAQLQKDLESTQSDLSDLAKKEASDIEDVNKSITSLKEQEESDIKAVNKSIDDLATDVSAITPRKILPLERIVTSQVSIHDAGSTQAGRAVWCSVNGVFAWALDSGSIMTDFYGSWGAYGVYPLANLYLDELTEGANAEVWYYVETEGAFYYWNGSAMEKITSIDFATQSDLAKKQDILTEGDSIKIENNVVSIDPTTGFFQNLVKAEVDTFILAGGGSADNIVALIQSAGLGNLYVKLVNSSEGDSVVTLNGSSVTIGAGETYEGYVDSFTAITRPHNLKSVVVVGDASVVFGDSSNENNTLESIEMYRTSGWSGTMSNFARAHYALKSVRVAGGKPTSLNASFYNCSALTSIDLSGLDTSACTTMYYMFNGCSALTSVDLSGLNTSQVTTMQSMFNGCSALTSIDLSGLNTSQVTTMQGMFNNCNALTEIIGIESLDTSQVTALNMTFRYCYALESLDLSNWAVEKVEHFSQMFLSCTALKSLTFGVWDMVNGVGYASGGNSYLYQMFSSMTALTDVTGEIRNIRMSLSVSGATSLTRESALVFINGLSDDPYEENPTLTLSSATKALLTDDDIAIATNKGWTIA